VNGADLSPGLGGVAAIICGVGDRSSADAGPGEKYVFDELERPQHRMRNQKNLVLAGAPGLVLEFLEPRIQPT